MFSSSTGTTNRQCYWCFVLDKYFYGDFFHASDFEWQDETPQHNRQKLDSINSGGDIVGNSAHPGCAWTRQGVLSDWRGEKLEALAVGVVHDVDNVLAYIGNWKVERLEMELKIII